VKRRKKEDLYRTQETGNHKKLTAPDETSDDENGEGESQTLCRRI
jgi:hypothetical protein